MNDWRNSRVRCGLCAHRCLIRSGENGICRVRVNQDGTLMSMVYGRAISANLDPIEKETPLPFPAGFHLFFRGHGGLQYVLRPLPES